MSEENIFNEVEEELRSERMRALWKKFAPLVIGVALAIILVVAGKEVWTWWNDSNSARSSDQFYSAIELAEEGNIVEAQEVLNGVINEASGKYPVLAQFRQASLLLESGKAKEAVAAYDALSVSVENKRMRELALIFAAYALVDSGDVKAVEQRVNGFSFDNPLRHAANEAIGLAKYSAGDIDGAREVFAKIIADPFVSNDVAGRVQLYIAQLVAQGAKEPEVEQNNVVETEVVQSPVQ